MTGYGEIAAHYREVIHRGDMRPGDSMPSYAEATQRHQVNRTTVVRAYDVLKSEGLIVSQPGRGTVVAKAQVIVSGSDRLDRLDRTGRKYAAGEESTGHRVMMRSCADVAVCQALDIDPGDEVIIRIRTFRQDGQPTTVGLSIIHPRAAADVPEITQDRPLPTFWQTLYTERTGRQITQGRRTAQARQASQDELDALEIDAPPHAAVAVLVTHVTFRDDDGPIEHWEDVYAPGATVEIPPRRPQD